MLARSHFSSKFLGVLFISFSAQSTIVPFHRIGFVALFCKHFQTLPTRLSWTLLMHFLLTNSTARQVSVSGFTYLKNKLLKKCVRNIGKYLFNGR